MDEAARTSGPPVERKRGPGEIREDIEQTREELGETVEALAAKTDVKAQARAKVQETKQRALDTVDTVKDRVGGAKAADLKEAARAKAAPVTQRIGGARNGGPAAASSTPPAAKRGDVARLLRSHPELFGLVAAFAAGVLLRSLAGS
jgi:hypothetical protein